MTGFTQIDNGVINLLPEIGLAVFAVYVALRRRCNDKGFCWPSIATIAADVGLTERCVQAALKRLAKVGLIEIERRHDDLGRPATNMYKATTPPNRDGEPNDPLPRKKQQGDGERNDGGMVNETTYKQEPIEQEPMNKMARAQKFTKPTIKEVQAYCRERKNSVDPQQFLDHYEARGWKFKGGQSMKDWHAAVRTWERNGFQTAAPAKPKEPIKYRG